MSLLKNKKFYLAVLLTLCAVFAFGCKNTVEPEDIYFDLTTNVFLVGEDFSPSVVVTPTYASDTSYTITSMDSSIVSVIKNVLHMEGEGTALIKVVANANTNLQDVVAIEVVSTPQQLSAPTNLSYDASTATISFDPVTNASSYTLKINNYEIELGNTTNYTLAQFEAEATGEAYDKTLTIQVRANASANTNAFVSSDFSSTISIYQASAISSIKVEAGVLTFAPVSGIKNYAVYLAGDLIKEISTISTADISVDLSDLLSGYAGRSNLAIKVVAVVDGSTLSGVDCYNGESASLSVTVLATPTLSMSGTTLTWTNLSGVGSYKIYIAGQEVKATSNNYFDLTTLSDFDDYGYTADGYAVYIDFIISDENILRTSETSNLIIFNRLATPEIAVTETADGFSWESVADNSGYVVELFKDAENTPIFSNTIYTTSLSISNYASGSYTIKVYAIGQYDATDAVYYISSATVTFTAEKLASASELSITTSLTDDEQGEKYIFTFVATAGDKYYVVVDEGEVYSDTVTAGTTSVSIDFADYAFTAGEHTISVANLADSDSEINSNVVTKIFVQLEAINPISINAGSFEQSSTGTIYYGEIETLFADINSTVSVSLGSINSVENLYFEIVNSDSGEAKYKIDASEGNLTVDGDTVSFTINTVYSEKENSYYLSAGNYTINLYIKGDSSSEINQFSVQESKKIIATASAAFTVLDSADLDLEGTSSNVLTLTQATKASMYVVIQYVLDADGEYQFVCAYSLGNTATTMAYTSFAICDPIEFLFQIVAVGDGVNTLNSVLTDACVVTYLYAPELKYDADAGTLTFEDNAGNDSSLVEKYVVTHSYTIGGEDYTDSYTITKNGDNYTVSYTPRGSSVAQSVTDFDFINNGFSGFKEGENVFTVTAVSRLGGTDGQYYHNSDTNACTLTLNMIASDATITVDASSNLVITRSSSDSQYGLTLRFKVDEETYIFETQTSDENGGILYCEALASSLSYTYASGVYTITMLENYLSVVSELSAGFKVAVKFTSDDEEVVDSTYTSDVSVSFAVKSQIGRSGNTIYFSKYSDYSYLYYTIYINNEYEIPLYAFMALNITSGETYVSQTDFDFNDGNGSVSAYAIDFEKTLSYLESNVSGIDLSGVISISVVSLNNDNTASDLIMTNLSDTIYVQRLTAPTFTASKDNSAGVSNTNSTTLSFNIIDKTYIKNYEVIFYQVVEGGTDTKIYTATFTNGSATDGVISISLDEYVDKYSITGTFYLTLKVYVSDTATDSSTGTEILIFESDLAQSDNYTVLDAVTDLTVKNGVLTIPESADTHILGYNIYYLDGSEYVKLNASILEANEYDLATLTGKQTIVVRAISYEKSNYTNSSLSTSITVTKLNSPVVSISDYGEIVVTLSETAYSLFTSNLLTLYLTETVNSDTSTSYEITALHEAVTDTDGENYTITLNPATILTYGENSILKVTLAFSLKISDSYDTTPYYLNSATITKEFEGLLDVVKIEKTTDAESLETEILTWTNNTANSELTLGYIIEITCGGVTYSSRDYDASTGEGLVYQNSDGTYSLFPAIITSATAVTFPAGYGVVNNGSFVSGTIFGSGTYEIKIIVVPSDIADRNLLASSASYSYTLVKLGTIGLSVVNGYVSWTADASAEQYYVRIYDEDGETLLDNEKITVATTDIPTIFDLSNFQDYEGLIWISVQSLSSKKNVLNSPESEKLCVYRLNQAVSVKVDDGMLILTANEYFSSAIITFTDTEDNSTDKISFTYSRAEDASTLLGNLNKTGWSKLTDEELASLETETRFTISIQDSTILSSLLSGHSYTVSVKLIGNSSTSLPIVNSYTTQTLSSIMTTKMVDANYDVTTGVLDFSSSTNFDPTIYYNLNNISNLDDDWGKFWSNTLIYKLTLTVSGTTHIIYAVDYYAVQNYVSGWTENTQYTLASNKGTLWGCLNYADGVYISVFIDNQIDFSDSILYYYAINTSETDGQVSFSSPSADLTTINLSDGAAFTVSISIMGGDTYAYTNESLGLNLIGYLTGNPVTTDPFIRYGSTTLSSLNGYVATLDEHVSYEDTTDYPVYKLVVNGSTIVYLYYSEVYSEENGNLSELYALYGTGENILYREVVLSEANDVTYVTYDFADFTAGTYSVTVQILAGKSSNYALDASEPTGSYVFQKISTPTIGSSSSTGGMSLQINLGSVGSGSNITYIYDYEITITDDEGNTYTYTINSTSDGVTLNTSGHYLVYTLSSTIETDDATLTLENSGSYSIAVKAITTSSSLINSDYSAETEFTISSGFVDGSVEINNGVLNWAVSDTTNYNGVGILISYTTSDRTQRSIWITPTDTTTSDNVNYSYGFSDATYQVLNSSLYEALTSGVNYTISLCTLGTTKSGKIILNSVYTVLEGVNLVEEVATSGIKSSNGVLTWTAVSHAVSYDIYLDSTYYTNTTYITYAFSDLTPGSYTISIRALAATGYLNAHISEGVTFTQLDATDSITVSSRVVTWNAVSEAQGYKVVFNYTLSNEAITETIYVTDLTAGTTTYSCTMPTDVSGKFTIYVYAIGVGDGYVFNGEPATYTSDTATPEAIGTISVGVVNGQWIYYWTASDFGSSDSFEINYDFAEYNSTYPSSGKTTATASSTDTITIKYSDAGTITIGSVTYYYYAPTAMGVYSNFTISVVRGSSEFTSAPVTANAFDFNIYEYGDGTAENPYVLTTLSQLLNIKYFPTANFKLGSAISFGGLSSNEISELLSENGGWLVYSTFGGTLDGDGKAIYGFGSISLENTANFALFAELSGATIKNLLIGEATEKIALTMKYSASTDINVALLALSADGTTISDVTLVSDCTITLETESSTILTGKIYLAGLVGTATDTTLSDIEISTGLKFVLNAETDSWYSYIGGLVAQTSSGLSISSSTLNVSVSGSSSKYFYHIGGAVGSFTGESTKAERTSGITDTSVEFNLSDVYVYYVGGLVGTASYINISGCETSGAISYSFDLYPTESQSIYIGGLVGYVGTCGIATSGTSMTFTMTFSNGTATYAYVGAIAGYIAGSSSADMATITDCYAAYSTQNMTEKSDTGITAIGAYGSAGSYVDVNSLGTSASTQD